MDGSEDPWYAEFIDSAKFRLGSELTLRSLASDWTGVVDECLLIFDYLCLQVAW